MSELDAHNYSYEGALTVLFQSDELATYEFRRTAERKLFSEPEKNLLYAVLEDAILCYQRFVNATGRKEQQLHQNAAHWIFAPNDNRLLSFEFVSEICGVDPDFLRMGLWRWREQNRFSGATRKAMGQRATSNTKSRDDRRRDQNSRRKFSSSFRG